MHENKNIKQNEAAILPISKLSLFIHNCFSMDNYGPLNPVSEKNKNNYVFFDDFSKYIVTVPIPGKNAE